MLEGGESVVFDVSLELLPSVDELSDGEPGVEPRLKGREVDEGLKRDEGEDGFGRSGSMVSAPGVIERRRMSRRASTSRWMSYSEGWRAMRKGWAGLPRPIQGEREDEEGRLG